MGYIKQHLGLLAILCLASFTAGAAGLQFHSGITGQVLLHNPFVIRLAPTNGAPSVSGSTTPFSASFRVYSARTGQFVTSFATWASGRFTVSLPSGTYSVVPESMWRGEVLQPGMIVIGNYESAPPFAVRVRPHRFTSVTVLYEERMGY